MAFSLVNFTSCSKDILVLKKKANEVPYDVIYSTNSVKGNIYGIIKLCSFR